MKPEVFWHPQAEQDLHDILSYFARTTNEAVAEDFERDLDSALELLVRLPLIGNLRSVRRLPTRVRLWVLKRFDEYLLVYSPRERGIELFRIIHAKRDYTRVL